MTTDFLIKNIEYAAANAHVWGFAIIFVLMLIESAFVPIPSEIVMIPAGFLAFRGVLTFNSPHLDVITAIIVGGLGSLTGSIINYYVSLWISRPIIYKFGKYIFLKPKILGRAERLFRKYGDISIFVCRFIPAIRMQISTLAGLSRMNLKRFSFYTIIGSLIWCAILTYIGYYLGRVAGDMTYAEIIRNGKDMLTRHYGWIIFALVVIVAAYFYLHHKIMHGADKS